MPTRSLALTDDQAELIDRLVATGRYPDAGAVLRAALRLVERGEPTEAERLAAFDAAIEEAEQAYRDGRYTVLSGKEEIRDFVRRLGPQR